MSRTALRMGRGQAVLALAAQLVPRSKLKLAVGALSLVAIVALLAWWRFRGGRL